MWDDFVGVPARFNFTVFVLAAPDPRENTAQTVNALAGVSFSSRMPPTPRQWNRVELSSAPCPVGPWPDETVGRPHALKSASPTVRVMYACTETAESRVLFNSRTADTIGSAYAATRLPENTARGGSHEAREGFFQETLEKSKN